MQVLILGMLWRDKNRKEETHLLRKLKMKVILNNVVDMTFQDEVPKRALGCKKKLKILRSN